MALSNYSCRFGLKSIPNGTVNLFKIFERFHYGNLKRKFTSRSIDPDEVKRFSQNSSKWWQTTDYLPLQRMNSLRVPFIVNSFKSEWFNRGSKYDSEENIDSIRFPLKDLKLLDIGCGGGYLSEPLTRLGADVIGIDPVIENIKSAENHAKISFKNSEPKLAYKCCSIEEFSSDPNNQNSFDAVIASEVLEHVEDKASFLQNSIACIRPGGFYIITTINQTLLSYFGTILMAEYLLRLNPIGTHQYEKFTPPEVLDLILEDCKFFFFLSLLRLDWRKLIQRFFSSQTFQ